MIESSTGIVHTLGAFRLTRTALLVDGQPTFDESQYVGDWLEVVQGAVQFWWGDWLLYMESRPDFKEKLSQALSVSGYAMETLSNLKYVASKVDQSRRRDGVSWSVHAAVAALPAVEQDAILADAASEHMTVAKVRAKVQAIEHAAVGKPVTRWLIVSCADEADQDALSSRMELEGRSTRRHIGD